MPVYKDADELYALLGGLFEGLATDPETAPRLQAVDTVLQLRMRRPDTLVTIKALAEEQPAVELGITELRPEVTMLMEADTAHGLWLGQVNPADALARGRIRAQGPVVKILEVIPLIEDVRERYAGRLAQAGRDDLAGAAAPDDGQRRAATVWRSVSAASWRGRQRSSRRALAQSISTGRRSASIHVASSGTSGSRATSSAAASTASSGTATER